MCTRQSARRPVDTRCRDSHIFNVLRTAAVTLLPEVVYQTGEHELERERHAMHVALEIGYYFIPAVYYTRGTRLPVSMACHDEDMMSLLRRRGARYRAHESMMAR